MKSIAEINAIRDRMKTEILLRDNSAQEQETQVVVGMATCGIAAGAVATFNALVDEVVSKQLHHVKVSRSGCEGNCELEPIVEVFEPGKAKVTYVKVDAAKAKEIIDKHILGGNVCKEYMLTK